MKNEKKFYALYDETVSPNNPGYGFCNAKRAISFPTITGRNLFVEARGTFDFSCSAIRRKEAMRYL